MSFNFMNMNFVFKVIGYLQVREQCAMQALSGTIQSWINECGLNILRISCKDSAADTYFMKKIWLLKNISIYCDGCFGIKKPEALTVGVLTYCQRLVQIHIHYFSHSVMNAFGRRTGGIADLFLLPNEKHLSLHRWQSFCELLASGTMNISQRIRFLYVKPLTITVDFLHWLHGNHQLTGLSITDVCFESDAVSKTDELDIDINLQYVNLFNMHRGGAYIWQICKFVQALMKSNTIKTFIFPDDLLLATELMQTIIDDRRGLPDALSITHTKYPPLLWQTIDFLFMHGCHNLESVDLYLCIPDPQLFAVVLDSSIKEVGLWEWFANGSVGFFDYLRIFNAAVELIALNRKQSNHPSRESWFIKTTVTIHGAIINKLKLCKNAYVVFKDIRGSRTHSYELLKTQ